MSKHSDRAMKGTRTQINAQIRFIQTNLTIKKKELSKAMQYKKIQTPRIRHPNCKNKARHYKS